MIEPHLFSLAEPPDADLERTGGLHVAADELMEALMQQASWEQRSRGCG